MLININDDENWMIIMGVMDIEWLNQIDSKLLECSHDNLYLQIGSQVILKPTPNQFEINLKILACIHMMAK